MANDMDVKTAIQDGDADALRRLLTQDPSQANASHPLGTNDCVLTHPLHYVSDMLFEGTLKKGKELALVEALIQAGADLDFQRDGSNGKSDTPLIGAASLAAEEVGLMLLDAGARPELRGLFRETALHWAALLGEDRLKAPADRRLGCGPQGRKVQFVASWMGGPWPLQLTCGEPGETARGSTPPHCRRGES